MQHRALCELPAQGGSSTAAGACLSFDACCWVLVPVKHTFSYFHTKIISCVKGGSWWFERLLPPFALAGLTLTQLMAGTLICQHPPDQFSSLAASSLFQA